MPSVLRPRDWKAMRCWAERVKKSMPPICPKVRKAVSRAKSLETPLSEIRPETPMNMKLHAFLHLVEEHRTTSRLACR